MRLFSLIILCWFTFQGFAQKTASKDSCIFVPSSLSKANGQQLEIVSTCDLSEFKIQIFSRWGNLLYESSSFMQPFDMNINERTGKKNEIEKYPVGTYFYTISYRKYNEQNSISFTGYLMIL